MNYKQLLEIIEEMDAKEQEQEILVSVADEYMPISIVSVITHSDNEEAYPAGTVILS